MIGGSGLNGIPGSSSINGQSTIGGHYIESSVVQVDECMLRPGLCGGGACIDTPDGYECQCYPGYVRKKNYPPGGGASYQTCEDINECNQGFCQGGTCVNAPGSFTCTCPPGFDVSSDGKLCIDHDECSQNGMCANGMCINMDGSFKCQCKPGFVLSPTGHACTDVDECYENPLICLNGRCDNTIGSYRCACQPGYSPSPDGGFCVDLDECAAGSDRFTGARQCENGKCVNTDGSYKCVCDSGYRLAPDTKSCVDIDECVSSPCQNGKCLNTLGSFRCQCLPGFNLGQDGRSCVDIRRDLCYGQYKEGQCSSPSSTPVTKSSCCCTGGGTAWGTPCLPCPGMGSTEFNTLCPHGTGMTYSGDDINECSQNPGICTNGACENLMGTYRCICNPGYEVDSTGKLCTDLNECLIDSMICSGGTCKNTPGSFQCICPTGTQLNTASHTCQDIDECDELGMEACQNGNCVNTIGSYECECEPGSIVDNTGTICIDNRKGSCWTRLIGGKCENNLPRLTLKTECCCSIGLAWGSPCEICHQIDCECQRGYAKLDGKVCSDVNECQVNPGLCKGGATCVNTEGSFTCVCPPGLSLDSTGTQCVDLRLETCFTDHKHGSGLAPVRGVYPKATCCCSLVGKAWGAEEDRCDLCPKHGTPQFNELCPKGPGYMDKKDINECLEFPEICTNGRCRNGLGTFSCKCNQGYALDELGLKCIDIDECSILHGICGDGECQNIPGSFTCNCKEGYRSTAMMQICTDIDECAETPGLCRGGQCKNTPGSYHCVCPPGHELAPDKQSCKDIDECSRTSGICSNGICENMMGTYECVCSDGYAHTELLRTHCEDIDECAEDNGECAHTCVNVPGSYSCACTTGYSLTMDQHKCVDINECALNKRICNGGLCNNTIGSYICTCDEGLRNALDLSTCYDINECEESPDICSAGTCENNIGSFSCRCEVGYSVKPAEGPACTDENECTMRTHNCDDNADCINNPGSFACRCKDGFVGNGLVCRDINECLTNNGGCNQKAQCINNDGSFKCVCDEGFRGDGYSCEDIDECTDNANYCENGHCLNYPGSFRCECEMGFMNPDDKNEQACVDINECQMFSNLCVYGRCENTFGMFRCECNDGFQLDNSGGNCTDINECESPQACLYGNCTNTLGSFSCACPPNYHLTPAGNACVDKRESRCFLDEEEDEEEEDGEEEEEGERRVTCTKEVAGSTTKSTCCCSIGRAWGIQCEQCPRVGSEEHKTLCPGGSGYRPNSATVVLEDINECDEHENICENGHCTNTFGSFMCSCQDGFRLDKTGTRCVDVDECLASIQRCGAGFCVNDIGTYHCICPDGYMLLPSGKECIDMRREYCYLNYTDGICSLPMSNEQTRMVCCCSMGQAWGKPCQACPPPASRDYILLCGSKPGEFMNPMTNRTEEIDECGLMTNMCNHGTCMNTPGSFHCLCNRGFLYDSDSHQCIDDNECNRIPTPCRGNAQCINSPGSYECQCPDGYKLGPTMRECIDIDECTERAGSICANGDCANFQGSFQCTCANGYTLNTARDSCVDIDECARHPNICNNGTCVNAVGSFKCHCYAGFKLSHNNDCIDMDECRMMSYLCRNGRCRNNIGSFFCECHEGYTLATEGQHCRDIDECKEREGICPSPGKCQNLMGSFLCTCPPGYRLSPDKNSCIDINECKENEGICEDGKCINIAGGVTCECPEGFVLSPNGMKCIDVRQDVCYDTYQEGTCTHLRKEPITVKECCCSMGQAWGRYCLPCPAPNSEDFTKLCPEGVGRGDKGEDLNECALMPTACQGGECINTDGSYRCECPVGYVIDDTGKICVDDNECVSVPNICGNGTCTNLNGGFECTCSEGYTPGPLGICEDINECLEMSNQCAFRCHNVPGSFRCICPYGYSLAPDGRHCIDVDECRTPANTCKFSCKNLIGSYMCICPPGYKQTHSVSMVTRQHALGASPNDVGLAKASSHDCVDVNECELGIDECVNGVCVNLEGSYRCECNPGFKLSVDGKKCIDQRVGFCYRSLSNGRCVLPTGSALLLEVTRMDCCCTMGVAWGPQCQMCASRGSQEYTEQCLESGLTVDGHDIDECITIPDLCQHGKCINTQGSYRCVCNKGYKLYQGDTKCKDVNECEQYPGICAHTCTNTEGSYSCGCHPGFELSYDGSGSCVDTDECTTGRHICQQICVNTVGSYSCACKPGYRQDGDHCRDIDECKEESTAGGLICPKPGTCINTMGSYRCLCPRGFKLDKTGQYCVDQDECKDDNKCREGCLNLVGGFKCSCPEGYVKHPFSNECIDDNECSRNPCGNTTSNGQNGSRGGKCFNTAGSYRCGCPDGFQFETGLQLCTKLSTSCLSSPCSFGCTPLGISGFSCACPSGYTRIGQGHCLATISTGVYPGFRNYEIPNLGAIPSYPIVDGGGEYYNDKIISTEGCFSCKINGRHRRTLNHTQGVGAKRKGKKLDRKGDKRKRRHGHGNEPRTSLRITLDQTKHRSQIIKLQPAIKNDFEYFIEKGNEANQFEMNKRHGVWRLHFRKRIKHPGVFYLIINSHLIQNTTREQHNESDARVQHSENDMDNMIEPKEEGNSVSMVTYENNVKEMFTDTEHNKTSGDNMNLVNGDMNPNHFSLEKPIRLHLKIHVVP
uniref:Fibrillin-2 n=1 Tax=Cacopsylla melanoneura TaxID=428564 RepID=A0A8D8X304_9HEMI